MRLLLSEQGLRLTSPWSDLVRIKVLLLMSSGPWKGSAHAVTGCLVSTEVVVEAGGKTPMPTQDLCLLVPLESGSQQLGPL